MSTHSTPVAVVTGAASGIGLSLARALHARQHVVVLADIDRDAGQREAAALGDRALFVETDVGDAEAQQRLIDLVRTRFGRLDLFVNNAGIEISGEVRELALDHWHRAIRINLLGVIYGTVGAYKAMVEQGSGHIVNVASGAGLIMFPTSIPYTTAKAGVVGLTRALRAEAAAYGVRVTLVCPGMVATPIWKRAESVGPAIADFAASLPGRTVTAERAARYILDGMDAGQREITFPFENALGAWLVNAIPPLGDRLRRDLVQRFRKLTSAKP